MKKSIFLMIMFLLIPLNVFATNDINIVCDKTNLKINEETSCKLNVTNLSFTAIDVTGKISLGNNLQLVSSTYDKNIWLSLDNNFNVTDINLMRHNNDKVDSITIATFRIKASAEAVGDSNIAFNNIAFGNSDYESISLNCNPLNIHFGNNINTLKRLNIKGHGINFASDKTDYFIETDQSNVFIEAEATDKNAKINGIGNKNIQYGNNTFDITVTAENGSTKIYKINVNRKDNRSNINDLLNIKLSNGKIQFDKNVTEYVVNVENKIDNINITYELADKKSKAEIIGDTNLIEGENLLIIKVTAENQNIKEYKIKVIREPKVDITNSNKISSLKIKDHNISFDKNKTEYTINTNYEKLDIEITLEDKESKYEIIGNENLKHGSIITIKVTDKTGNANIYKINIKNQKEETPKNNKNLLLIIILSISIIYNIVITIFYLKKNK